MGVFPRRGRVPASRRQTSSVRRSPGRTPYSDLSPIEGERRRSQWPLLAALFLLLFALPALAAPKFPPLTGRVVDEAHILSASTVQQLDAELAGLERQTGRQVVVATIGDLQGYDIADYGYRLGRAW
jgi:uncharacterized protein